MNSFGVGDHDFRRLLDGCNNALVRAATADVAVHAADDFGFGGIGILLKQRVAAENHAGRAIGALHRTGVDERLLQRMQPAILFETCDGGDLFVADGAHRRLARMQRDSVNEHATRGALALAATVFTAGEAKVVAQDAQESAAGVDVDGSSLAIDVKLSYSRHKVVSKDGFGLTKGTLHRSPHNSRENEVSIIQEVGGMVSIECEVETIFQMGLLYRGWGTGGGRFALCEPAPLSVGGVPRPEKSQ
jgi:hypothetical protein